MPRVKLRPYAVILLMPAARPHLRRRMTVRLWASDREDALARAVEFYGADEAIAAQHCPNPLG
jgi:hypothetical protein